MTKEELEEELLDLTAKFNSDNPEVIYQPAGLNKLAEDIRNRVYMLDDEDAKEEYNWMALDMYQRFLNIRREENTITTQVFNMCWENISQVLYLYLEKGNKIDDTYKCLMRFLTYISGGREGQDPRLTCAPESMLDLLDYSKKIVKFLGDKSTEEILQKRLKSFAFQDTMESANKGNRNAIKYNATLNLLKMIGSKTNLEFIDECYKEGIPYETSEFGDFVALQNHNKDSGEIEASKRGDIKKKRPNKLR